LAALAGITADLQVLDVGCGIGGPARHLASQLRCRVTGIDLTAEFIRTATLLSDRVGLADRVAFVAGDALDLPFPAASFDLVWTQHAAMNIADRPRLYAEMHRVLRPRGRLALHDVLAGDGGAPHFPVPWARRSADSFLVDQPTLRRLLGDAGFAVREWRDVTGTATAWFAARRARLQAAPLGIGLLLGADFPTMVANQERNLAEGRVVVLQAVAVRN
jgi:SAM-dependent methyltransferase